MTDIRAATVLPARRTPITLTTEDGLRLVGELALPARPRAGRHARLPAPAADRGRDDGQPRVPQGRRTGCPRWPDLAVLRFNTRGTESEQGSSEGEFGDGETERYDVEAAVRYAAAAGLPNIWLLGWSFGTELTLRWGLLPGVEGGILLSPPLRRAGDKDLDSWAASGRPLTVLVPEFDDYLRPDEARRAFRPGAEGRGDRRGRRQAPVGGGEVRPHRARARSSPPSTRRPWPTGAPCRPPGTSKRATP